MEATDRSGTRVVESGEGKPHEGALLKRGYGSPAEGGPKEKPRNQRTERKDSRMSATNTTKWIGIGLLGLPIYGALTFWSSLKPQPSFSEHPEAWSRFVTTDEYLLTHLFGTNLGLIFAIFGAFALGVYLATSHAGRLGLVAMAITVFGSGLTLLIGGYSTFASPEQGQMNLQGIDGYLDMPPILAQSAFTATFALAIVLVLVGNVLLGVAVWRSAVLPKWAGAIWAVSALMFYVLGAVLGMVTTGGSLVTQPVGALLMVIGGAWMTYSVLRKSSSAEAVSVGAQPSVQ